MENTRPLLPHPGFGLQKRQQAIYLLILNVDVYPVSDTRPAALGLLLEQAEGVGEHL